MQCAARQERHDEHQEDLDGMPARIYDEMTKDATQLVDEPLDVSVAGSAAVVGRGGVIGVVGRVGATG